MAKEPNADIDTRDAARNGTGIAVVLTGDAALPWLGTFAFVALVEFVTRSGIVPQQFFPAPTTMFATLAAQFALPDFWLALWNTLWTWAASLLIASTLGIALGVAMGASRLLFAALRLIVEFLRPIPSVALIPAVILVIGINYESKIFLAAFAAFWPVLIQSIYGMHDVEPVAVETARSFGFGRAARLALVSLPLALPYIATGVRIGAAVALIIVVTMEIVIGVPGLGKIILEARQGANVERAYALILASGLLGWGLNTALARLESKLLFWHPSYRRAHA
ncbi:ABC transporter permease [Oricola thermophila]|uniref:ABC transporter permease n=1 Tax=Oricola thermophila TaxID=2742145 RepID=A0A6N1VFH9_9HYPH|nr:ABC transporter permease [Oricola thermophila]QKV19671.1 ABC transporter permease [Oricola thermophila]